MAIGNRRSIEIERRKMRLEAGIVDASAVTTGGTGLKTGLSSNTPNLLVRRSSAELIFTFEKNYTEVPVVWVTPIGTHSTAMEIKTGATAATFTITTDSGAEDFHIVVMGSEKPSV